MSSEFDVSGFFLQNVEINSSQLYHDFIHSYKIR